MNTFPLFFQFSGIVRDVLLVSTVSLFLLKASQVLKQSCIRSWPWRWSYKSKTMESDDPYNAYKRLPGPSSFPLRIIGNGFTFLNKKDLLQKLVDLAQKYGPYYRLTFLNEDYVCINSPEGIQAILSSNNYSHLGHGPLEEALFPQEIETMAIYPGGEKWKGRRKMLSRSFMYKALQFHNPCFYKYCERLTFQLEKRFETTSEGIVSDLLMQCSFGISSETMMGVDLEETEKGAGALFCQNLELFMRKSLQRWYRPWQLLPWVWHRSSDYKESMEALNSMIKVSSKVLEKYKEKMGTEEMTDTMIEVMVRNGMDDRLIFNEIGAMLAIANDTTPLSAENVLFMISLHPEHQNKCREEIDAVYAEHSKGKQGSLGFEALKELKYLERCIQETLRINPLTILLRRLEAPLRINEELLLPAGISIMIPPNVVHHLPQHYPNPGKFEPDRFLPEQVRVRHPYAYIPFSAGPRNCIGMKLAMIELKVMLATILRNFEVGTPDTKEDVQIVLEGTMKPSKPIRFNLTKRKVF
ncbi:unnamed protein product [Orchesella dallaii]|uniref:Cytochrome P450 4C1 n=1 Tax=Orchesella dallaii TaxID=48710 RepID=A0ABP1Q5C5_9HEXA